MAMIRLAEVRRGGRGWFASVWRRENAEQRDTVGDRHHGLDVIVRLVAARSLDRAGNHCRLRPAGRSISEGIAAARGIRIFRCHDGIAGRDGLVGRRRWNTDKMVVGGNLLRVQRNAFRAGRPPDNIARQPGALTIVDRDSALEVREAERALSVAAISGADQVEKRFVLGNGQQLPGTRHPAGRRKIASEHDDLANERLGHF